MEVVRQLDEAIWREFVDNHPLGNIFHTPEMLEVFNRASGMQPTLWAVVNEGGQPLALFLPVKLTLLGGPLKLFTSRAVTYGSVLFAAGTVGQKALGLLLQAYKHENDKEVLFTELRNLSDLSAVQPLLQEQGFQYEDHLNYLIDLNRPPEAILQSIGRRTRKHIRKGLRREEVEIEEVREREQLATCYQLIDQTYQRAQVPLGDPSLFTAAFDVLHSKDMIRFTVARVGQTMAAVSVELIYKDTVLGWYSGVDRNFSSHTPNELLMWHILLWGAENGYNCYDFGGAGSPDEDYGVRDFKAKFGGELVCYGRNTYVHSGARLAISKVGYEVYRRLR